MIDLKPEHQALIIRLVREQFPTAEIRLFGSRYHNTARPYSDVDLCLVGQDKLDWLALARLRDALEESNLPLRVDILDWHAIPEHMRQTVAQGYAVLSPTP
ncbi:MAG: nucleotidyltransferase domain-containing protein [Anaerolineales bacterium]|nr:nucleotidyltransferase domain-containing protein [Anaerolineales bacterium]